MKSWVKGGLIGAGIGLVLSVILFLIMRVSYVLATPFYFLTLPVRFLDYVIPMIIAPFFSGAIGISRALIIMIELPFEGLIIGIIIGLIVGKIKSKNEVR